MKHLLLTTIAAVVLVGCGPKAPDISIEEAAMDGDIEAVKQHLAAGADVNAVGIHWGTPLQFAAKAGHKEVAELLIAEGADVNAKIRGGWTALDEVTHPDNPNSSAEIADLLRKHGGKTGEALKAEGK